MISETGIVPFALVPQAYTEYLLDEDEERPLLAATGIVLASMAADAGAMVRRADGARSARQPRQGARLKGAVSYRAHQCAHNQLHDI